MTIRSTALPPQNTSSRNSRTAAKSSRARHSYGDRQHPDRGVPERSRELEDRNSRYAVRELEPGQGFRGHAGLPSALPKIDGVWAGDDDAALGAMEAIKTDRSQGRESVGPARALEQGHQEARQDGNDDVVDATSSIRQP